MCGVVGKYVDLIFKCKEYIDVFLWSFVGFLNERMYLGFDCGVLVFLLFGNVN